VHPSRIRLHTLLLSVALGILAVGCSGETVVLWTDRADAAPAVELFNHSQDRYVVELRLDEEISRRLRLEATVADVVIADAIEDESTSRLFRPLDRLLGEPLDPGEFYSNLLENGQRGNRQFLLPVSFNLPLVYFAADVPGSGTTVTLAPETMRETGAGFNEIGEERAERLGFSPLWDGRFLYELTRYGGFSVSEGESGEPHWELGSLLGGMNQAISWVEDDNGGISIDTAFREQFLYDPIIRLVQSGRILYGYDSSDHYFGRSDESRSGLDFLWFGDRGRVPVLETVVYAGIPDSAQNTAGAREFLTWFFTEEVQSQLIRSNRRNRIDSFGVVGGFSSLWRVTERVIPVEYPALAARVPPASWLQFPPPLPRHWAAVIDPVVIPWLLREASGESQSRDLTEVVSAWLLQQEE
jgi:ABC-type glycerol-3-phosphate transport system substrate-binding protein